MRELSVRFERGRQGLVPIVVGRGALARLAADLTRERVGRVVVVSDARVATLYGRKLVATLRGKRLVADLLTFPRGESSKTRETKAKLEDRLLAKGVGRDALIVALGGGVTGDLAGFLAATWHRGIPVVHAPTTLLAMTDSALGGKTGIDLPAAKNIVGAFHRPRSIYADLAVLDTLPEEEWTNGFAEVVKTAAVADRKLFDWLERSRGALRKRRTAAVEHAVAECLTIKGRVVARDEYDAGRRAVLNFGHTAAHAIEAASGYRIPHGRAVAIGLVAEGRLAVDVAGLPEQDYARLTALVGRLAGGPLHALVPRASFLRAARSDKKNREGAVRCALPVRIGTMKRGSDPTYAVDPGELYRSVRRIAARANTGSKL